MVIRLTTHIYVKRAKWDLAKAQPYRFYLLFVFDLVLDSYRSHMQIHVSITLRQPHLGAFYLLCFAYSFITIRNTPTAFSVETRLECCLLLASCENYTALWL